MQRAIYPGSFDPVTNGHLDIIARGCKLFDEIIIAILVNPEKHPFFTIDERRQMLGEVLGQIESGACTLRVDSSAAICGCQASGPVPIPCRRTSGALAAAM